MSLSRDSAALFSSRFIASVGELFAIYLFTDILGASNLGIYFLYFAVISSISTLSDLGLTSAIEKRISEGDNIQEYLSSGVALNVVLIIIISLIILVLNSSVNSYLGGEFAIFVIVGVICQRSSHIAAAVLKGELRVMLTAFFKPLRKLLWILFGYLFYLNNFGKISLIYSIILSYLIVGLIGWKLINTSFGIIKVKRIRSLVNYSKYKYISGNLYGALYNRIDVLFIGYYLSPTFVSAYEVAWRLSAMVMMLSQSISAAIFPQISSWIANGSKDRVKRVLPKIIIGSLFISIPAAFGVIILRHEALGILFSPEYIFAGQVLIILAFKSILESYQTIVASVINAMDQPSKMAIASVFTIFSAIILNIILIPKFALIGAAVATLAAFIINTMISHYFISILIEFKFPIKGIIKIVVLSTVMAIVLGRLKMMSPINSIFALISFVILGILIYLPMSFSILDVRKIASDIV